MNKIIGVVMLLFFIGAEVYGFSQWVVPKHQSTVSAEATLGALARGSRQ